MANAHNQFLLFEKAISLTPSKKKKLIASRQALEKRIREHFKSHAKLLVPKFYIQGSYKMGTMVMDKRETYDVDLGVYFLEKPKVEAISLQKNVYKAVKDHTKDGAEHRDKCIRVIYKGDFDIDIPVYYKTQSIKHPYLATKKNGWVESDPKELCDWFEKKKDNHGQLMRLVKYFKTWANHRAKKMPSGIALTVWIARHYCQDKRDDIAFYETAKAIKSDFGIFYSDVINPASPNDDLLAKLNSTQKNNFEKLFKQLIKEAALALEQKRVEKSCKIWRNQFGSKFPTIEI